MDTERDLRDRLCHLLRSGDAHATLESALDDLPAEHRGAKPSGQPHTVWRLLEHLRLAQWDILEFSRRADHVSPAWPDGYWPETDAPPSEPAWEEALASYERDLDAFCALLRDPASDLWTPFPWGSGQTLLREALVLADHQAYHVGQIVLLRQLLGSWRG